jgi:hypothetical protein
MLVNADCSQWIKVETHKHNWFWLKNVNNEKCLHIGTTHTFDGQTYKDNTFVDQISCEYDLNGFYWREISVEKDNNIIDLDNLNGYKCLIYNESDKSHLNRRKCISRINNSYANVDINRIKCLKVKGRSKEENSSLIFNSKDIHWNVTLFPKYNGGVQWHKMLLSSAQANQGKDIRDIENKNEFVSY